MLTFVHHDNMITTSLLLACMILSILGLLYNPDHTANFAQQANV